MKTSRKTWWALYVLGALLTLVALGWISAAVLDLREREEAGRLEHRRQQAIRLALWRMDSWFGPQLAVEVARLPHEYQAYTPQDLAYTKVLNQIAPGEVLVPSPLLSFESDIIRLHFQVDGAGAWTSPQVPLGNCLDLAQANDQVAVDSLRRRRALLEELAGRIEPAGLAAQLGGAECTFNLLFQSPSVEPAPTAGVEGWLELSTEDRALNRKERDWRVKVVQQAQIPTEAEELLPVALSGMREVSSGEQRKTRSSPLVPLWLEGLPGAEGAEDPWLIFVRRVRTAEGEVLQGFLTDWPHLHEGFAALVFDLLPHATLEAQHGDDPSEDPEGRLLATIPAMIVPGRLPAIARGGWGPGETTLLAGWLVALASLGVVGLGLRSSIRFGEQRNRFASTVSHELRTPLTTFRLYSEMLASGVVPADRRQEYLETLEQESERLNTLVENVLGYSRLEEGRSGLQKRVVPVAEVLEQARLALERRAAEASMALVLRQVDLGNVFVETDPEAVARILFNLVDNACKYGGSQDGEGGGEIELVAEAKAGTFRLRVRDGGSGVPRGARQAIFEPFDRGGRDSADPSPGVGLGLALARGLARDLGGDLVLEPTPEGAGASFCLRLPLGS
jgi:signal transduction histidine kinase